MPRRSNKSTVDPVRARQLRAAARREARKSNGSSRRSKSDKDPNDLSWIKSVSLKMAAAKILNNLKPTDYGFWLSIKHGKKDGNPPVAGYLPCRSFRTADRVYYGFAIREHRDEVHHRWDKSRKELFSRISAHIPS